jgi:hypothetical protein
MGSKKIHKKEDKKFRDFVYLDNRPATPAKFYYVGIRWARDHTGLQARQIEFMLFVHDLEFFTMEWVAQQLSVSYPQARDKLIGPLVRQEYLYKYFDRFAVPLDDEGMWFRDEHRWNFRVRYALTQKGKLFLSRFYKVMSGEEKLRLEYHERTVHTEKIPKEQKGPTKTRLRHIKGVEDSPMAKKLLQNKINARKESERASQGKPPCGE